MHFPISNIKHDALSYIVIYSRVTTQHFLRKHNSTNNFPKCVSPKNNVYAIWLFSQKKKKKKSIKNYLHCTLQKA